MKATSRRPRTRSSFVAYGTGQHIPQKACLASLEGAAPKVLSFKAFLANSFGKHGFDPGPMGQGRPKVLDRGFNELQRTHFYV